MSDTLYKFEDAVESSWKSFQEGKSNHEDIAAKIHAANSLSDLALFFGEFEDMSEEAKEELRENNAELFRILERTYQKIAESYKEGMEEISQLSQKVNSVTASEDEST